MENDLSANETSKPQKGDEGFTLVELLVVLAIIGLIAAIAAPQVLKYLGSARVDSAKAQMRNLESAVELFYIDLGRYPTTQEGLQILVERPANLSGWNGPYMKQAAALADPWGTTYQYKAPDGDAAYAIWSLGRDGKIGGDGLDADVFP